MKTGGLGLLAMRRVVSPIIDRVSTFVHRLYGRYPYRAVLAPMALDFPDRALYRAAAACPTLPRLRPMVSREEGVFNISMGGGFLD